MIILIPAGHTEVRRGRLEIKLKTWVLAVFMLAAAGFFGYFIGMLLRRAI